MFAIRHVLDSVCQQSVSPPLNVTDHHTPSDVPADSSVRNLDHILTDIKSDIKSFMDSVIQHQEDIISDIGKLTRNSYSLSLCIFIYHTIYFIVLISISEYINETMFA